MKFLNIFHLARTNNITDTPKYAMSMKTQTSTDKGDRNENKSGGCFTGFEKRMLMPENKIFKFQCPFWHDSHFDISLKAGSSTNSKILNILLQQSPPRILIEHKSLQIGVALKNFKFS